jgi:hypothetical protein
MAVYGLRTWQALTQDQEFSIEIPDKQADAIHSGTVALPVGVYCVLTLLQSNKQ